MPIKPPAITEENVAEMRRQAEDVTNINHAIPDRRNTARMGEDTIEALNIAGDRLARTDWKASDTEQLRVMSAWCSRLPNLGLVPDVHDPSTADWHWSAVRCFLAGAGFEAHAALSGQLSRTYSQCALRVDETYDEWMKALKEAHNHCGLPACISALPWKAFRSLPDVTKEDLEGLDTNWLAGIALLHILKHTRVYGKEVRVLYRGSALYFTRDENSNALETQLRLLSGMLPALHMARSDNRKKGFPLIDIGVARCLKSLSFPDLLAAKPLSAIPGNIIVGQFTQLLPNPQATGWFQHGLRMARAWVAKAGRTRVFEGTDETVMGYAWSLEAPSDDQEISFNLLARAVPATYEEESPFAILCNYQPNFSVGWVQDVDAYASIIDSVLIMAVMRDRVLGAREEFPIVWVLPEDPTPEGSTNQGKTTAVGAIAGAMTPGISVSRPPDSNSAPDMRAVAGTLRAVGTIALDEWSIPKNQNHPLSSTNMQVLAVGKGVSSGEVMANRTKDVFIRQPIVASAKCLHLREDVRNRSLFLFQRVLTTAERADVKRHDAMLSGEVSLRMRLAALSLVDKFKLDHLEPVGSDNFRFKLHVALAMKLYALRTGKSGPQCLVAITGVAKEIETRFSHHFTAADESGLMSEMESGECLSLRATTIFGTITGAEVVAMQDTLNETDRGRVTSGQLLQARAKVDANVHSVRGMLLNLLGTSPRANDRALSQAFGRDLRRLMPNIGDEWALPELLGIDGWRLKRCADAGGNTLRVRLVCTNPSSPHFKPIKEE